MDLVSFAAAVAAVLSGCADPVVFSEVFQLEKGQEIYTRYNLWYDDPKEVSCLNIQSGSFIPIGSVVEPIATDSFPERIHFRDKKSGKVFAIRFEEAYRLCTMRDFIAQTFTSKNPLDSIPEKSDRDKKIKARILRGEVVPGMTRPQVLLAYGPPPAARTPDTRNESWIYWVSDTQTIRLVFRGDTVRQILNIAD